jgi:two-component system response regulator
MDNRIILLIEDNPDDVDLTLRAFGKSNLKNPIVVVNDGEKALDYLFCRGSYSSRNPAEMPAVVLLDIKLPKVDGLEVLKELRSNSKTKLLPVVMLTSSMEESDLISSYQNGANSYIRKPVDFNRFIDSVQQLGLYWLLLNETPPVK